MQVTSLDQLKKIKTTDIESIGQFDDGTDLVVELRKPNLVSLITKGDIPNTLLKEAMATFRGGKELEDSMIKSTEDPKELGKMMGLIDIFAHTCMVNPKYQDLLDIGLDLTMQQKINILSYTQHGVKALKRFRKEQTNIESDKPSEQIQSETESDN